MRQMHIILHDTIDSTAFCDITRLHYAAVVVDLFISFEMKTIDVLRFVFDGVFLCVLCLAGSAGASSAPTTTIVSPNQTWDSGGPRDGGVPMENGARGGALPENWEMAFSDSGEPYYIE